jgi:hypothetical protein
MDKYSKKDIERFLTKYIIDENTNCWNCTLKSNRYPNFKLSSPRRQISGHRFSYIIHKGEIATNMFVCHSCDNMKCINPEHLFLGTSRDNIDDMLNKKRQAKGSNNGNAKLTEEKVKEIKIHLTNPYPKINEHLAEKYNVNSRTISAIRRNKIWSHVNI